MSDNNNNKKRKINKINFNMKRKRIKQDLNNNFNIDLNNNIILPTHNYNSTLETNIETFSTNSLNFQPNHHLNVKHQLLDSPLETETIDIKLITDTIDPPNLIDDLNMEMPQDNDNDKRISSDINLDTISETFSSPQLSESKYPTNETNFLPLNADLEIYPTSSDETPSDKNTDTNFTPILEYLDNEWYIGAQNINGLKDIVKQTFLFNIMDQEGINLMIVSETNMHRTDIKSMCRYQSKYQVFSTETPTKGKKKDTALPSFWTGK